MVAFVTRITNISIFGEITMTVSFVTTLTVFVWVPLLAQVSWLRQ